MHPDIEKLIELAVVDGKVTEKEKEILQRKANELNVDLDELDMVLEAKLFIQNRDSQENQTLQTTTEVNPKSNLEQKEIKVTKFFNEDYKEWLKKIVSKDKIIMIWGPEIGQSWNEDDIIKMNAIKIIDEGISINTDLIKGEHILIVRLEQLIFNPKNQFITEYTNLFSDEEFEESDMYFIKLFAEDRKEQAKYELEKLSGRSENAEEFIIDAYCFNLFNEILKAKECLHLAENNIPQMESSGIIKDQEFYYFFLAEAWKMIFGNDNEARKWLLKHNGGLNSVNHLQCSQWWKELLNDEREAKIFIKLAEDHKEPDWYEIAYVWKRLFNSEDEARRCIHRQENETENISSRWIRCAESWKKILNDDEEAKRCLNIAENIANKENARSMIKWCIDARKELFGSVEPDSKK